MVNWLTIEDLAAYLKKPKSSLYKLVLAKKIRGYKVGRSWRFDREEVDRWVKSRRLVTSRGVKTKAKFR